MGPHLRRSTGDCHVAIATALADSPAPPPPPFDLVTRMRPIYVFEKVCATAGTFGLIYVVTEHYISAWSCRGDGMRRTQIN